MRPSLMLDLKRNAIREAVSRSPNLTNPRVFGSVLHGTDHDGSDLDLLVDSSGASLFDLARLKIELESLLGVRVDLLTPGFLPSTFRDKVLAEAQPV